MYILFLTYKLDNNIKKMGTGKHVLPDGAGRWLGNYNRDWGHSNSIIKKDRKKIYYISSKIIWIIKIHNHTFFFMEEKYGIYFEIKRQTNTETRGSQEPVIAHLVFNLTSKVDRKWGCYT